MDLKRSSDSHDFTRTRRQRSPHNKSQRRRVKGAVATPFPLVVAKALNILGERSILRLASIHASGSAAWRRPYN